MGLALSLLFGFVPMLAFAGFVYWLDRYEKEPLMLLGGVFAWGAIVAAGAAFIVNTVFGLGVYLFTNSERFTDLTTGAIIAPMVEETVKGLAVLAVFVFFRREFDSILDGLVIAAMAALGFAATENVFYIYEYGYSEGGIPGLLQLVFIRVILVGWQHPFYTAFIGIGLALARMNPKPMIQLGAPILGLCIAIFNHSLHNILANLLTGLGGLVLGTAVDWTGWAFMMGVIVYAIISEQRYIRSQLQEEVSIGTITAAQYLTACSAMAQSSVRLVSLFNGTYQKTHHFYQMTGELAHKKQQRSRMGEEAGNSQIIEQLRAELRKLSPSVQA